MLSLLYIHSINLSTYLYILSIKLIYQLCLLPIHSINLSIPLYILSIQLIYQFVYTFQSPSYLHHFRTFTHSLSTFQNIRTHAFFFPFIHSSIHFKHFLLAFIHLLSFASFSSSILVRRLPFPKMSSLKLKCQFSRYIFIS